MFLEVNLKSLLEFLCFFTGQLKYIIIIKTYHRIPHQNFTNCIYIILRLPNCFDYL